MRLNWEALMRVVNINGEGGLAVGWGEGEERNFTGKVFKNPPVLKLFDLPI